MSALVKWLGVIVMSPRLMLKCRLTGRISPNLSMVVLVCLSAMMRLWLPVLIDSVVSALSRTVWRL